MLLNHKISRSDQVRATTYQSTVNASPLNPLILVSGYQTSATRPSLVHSLSATAATPLKMAAAAAAQSALFSDRASLCQARQPSSQCCSSLLNHHHHQQRSTGQHQQQQKQSRHVSARLLTAAYRETQVRQQHNSCSHMHSTTTSFAPQLVPSTCQPHVRVCAALRCRVMCAVDAAATPATSSTPTTSRTRGEGPRLLVCLPSLTL